jgi:hypothetical protein
MSQSPLHPPEKTQESLIMPYITVQYVPYISSNYDQYIAQHDMHAQTHHCFHLGPLFLVWPLCGVGAAYCCLELLPLCGHVCVHTRGCVCECMHACVRVCTSMVHFFTNDSERARDSPATVCIVHVPNSDVGPYLCAIQALGES